MVWLLSLLFAAFAAFAAFVIFRCFYCFLLPLLRFRNKPEFIIKFTIELIIALLY